MESQKENRLIKWLILPAVLLLFAVNTLSTMLPLNGITPQEVSAQYPNLFVPAPFVFSIWGVIYLLILGYVLYQFGLFRKKGEVVNAPLLRKTGIDFIVTCVLNAAWLFAWHYGLLILSFGIIVLYLLTLISLEIMIAKEPLTRRESLLIRLPFSVNFGWLSVATIANATALLVGLGFGGLGITEAVWTIIILAVGAVIAIATALRFRDAAYLAVFLWAYTGILLNHTSKSGFAGAYPGVVAMASISLAAFAAVFLALLISPRLRAQHKPE
jgi:hypothetical protein